jgi:hypothetical protein
MKTIQSILLSLFFFVIALNGFSQDAEKGKFSPEQREKIEALKVSFLTTKMNLTPEEAQKFWPVYNKFSEEKHALKKDVRELKQDAKSGLESMSDSDVNKYIEQKFLFEQKELELKKKYLAEFKKVLPVKKIALMYQAEDEFKKHLLEQIQKPHQPGAGERVPPKKF